jgi:hypothetical protein
MPNKALSLTVRCAHRGLDCRYLRHPLKELLILLLKEVVT